MKEDHLEKQLDAPPLGARIIELAPTIIGGLGVVFLILVVFGVILTPPTESQEVLADLRTGRESLRDQLDTTRIDLQVFSERVAVASDGALAISSALTGTAPEVERVSPWSRERESMWRQGKSNVAHFGAPTGLVVDPERGFNRVRFVADLDTTISVREHVIERMEGAGKFATLTTLPMPVTEYEDRAVKPGVTYGYRVAALTEEVFVPSDQRRSPFSSQVSVVAATDFRLTILTTDESKKSIELQVEKWHNNRWWTKVFEVSQGDTIGTFDEGTGVD
jgi:hypothetical protein